MRPDAVVEQVAVGFRFIGIVAGGRVGLSSLLGACPAGADAGLPETVLGRTAAEAAKNLAADSPFAICLGLAAVNAANAPDPASDIEAAITAENLIVDLGRDKSVGLVGHFPFTEALRQAANRFHLFELREVPGAVERNQWEAVLAGLDLLAVTGTALLTRQMAFYLSHAAQAVIVILGPTTPLSPVLFDFGADYLCGSVVTDNRRVLDGVRAGLPFRALKKSGGIRFVNLAAGQGA
jgi:uncharacterized protein (DUF4213/DUF364 family)